MVATRPRDKVRTDKNLHLRKVHSALVSSNALDEQIARVIEDFQSRIGDYKLAKAQKTPVPVKRFVAFAQIRRICKTTIWTVNEAFARLPAEDRVIYERGLTLAAVMRAREAKADRRDYKSYPRKLCWAVLKFVRRRIVAMRPIISIPDLARQYGMHPDAVSKLLRDRLTSEEHATWKKLVHLEKTTTVKLVKKRDPEGQGSHESRGKINNQNLAVARGWQRYPECQLHRLRDFVIANFHAALAGEAKIVGYRQLRKDFGVAVTVIGDYLLSVLTTEMFLERKRLSQSHPRKGKEPSGSSKE